MQRFRQEAARQGRTMSELVEAGLRLVLDARDQNAERASEPLPQWQSGGVFVVDTNVLLYAADADSEFHEPRRELIERSRGQAAPWFLTGICQLVEAPGVRKRQVHRRVPVRITI